MGEKMVATPTRDASQLYCPLCGSVLEYHTGVIDEPVITGAGVRRARRPGSYLLCTGCEWGDEVAALLSR